MANGACVFTEIGFIVLSGWCRPLFPSWGKESTGGAAAGRMTDRHHVIEHARSTLPLTSLYNMSLLTCARHPSGNSAHIPQSLSGLIRQLPYIRKAGCIVNLFILFSGWVQCTTQRGHVFFRKQMRSTHLRHVDFRGLRAASDFDGQQSVVSFLKQVGPLKNKHANASARFHSRSHYG